MSKENFEYCNVPIHFGNFQGEHKISSSSLSIFIEAYKEISKSFGIEVEVQIEVPTEGGWMSNLIVTAGIIGLNPFVALLTGETADDWAKKGHTEIIKYINEYVTTEAINISDDIPKECTKQKNKIYKQFQKDNCIDTFKIDDLPAIPKLSFQKYIKEIPEEETIYLGETDITVHSPDWKGKRSWKGKIEILTDKENAFDFDKDLTGKFWEKIKLDLLILHTTDVMRVQLIKRPTNKVKYLVIRVLKYNEDEIDTPISVNDINKFAFIDTSKEEALNLFSFEYGQEKGNK